MLKEDIIEMYFKDGFKYKEILLLLSSRHHIQVSMRTLHRILENRGLKRKNLKILTRTVVKSISDELKGSASLLGYRAMHKKLVSKGIMVDMETVRLALKELDPVGVETRQKHKLKRRKYSVPGVNYLWHLDGNDKLKYYGFCIHGCIDGQSRKLLWLNVAPSNKDPSLIAKYYIDYVHKVGGTAKIIRGDRGVENAHIAGMQRYFHRTNNNSTASFFIW